MDSKTPIITGTFQNNGITKTIPRIKGWERKVRKGKEAAGGGTGLPLPGPWERKVVGSGSELAARRRARLGLEAAGPISVP